MRSWSNLAIAVLLAVHALACPGQRREPGAPAARPAATSAPATLEVWGRVFRDRFSRGAISFLEHRDERERIDLKLVRQIDPGPALDYATEEMAKFRSLFTPLRTGYPGQHTKYIQCPDEYRPSFHQADQGDGFFHYTIAYANANHVAGACSDDLARYLMASGYLYCRSHQALFELDYFVSRDHRDRLESFLARVGCDLSPPFRSFVLLPVVAPPGGEERPAE
jgi:hypothetical protein